MPESNGRPSRGGLFWLGVAAAVVLPAALSLIFWGTTPAVGGWSQVGVSPSESSAGVDYSQNGRLPVGAAATSGRSLYLQNCSSCHGANLAGTATIPALKRPNWPYQKDRDLLVRIIHQGRGFTMPSFDGRLSNQQINAIADYIQSENGAK
jgi:mono/diheme cytochrome c family protein